jgi:high-affinity Fe2+/Pb2+ permease
MSKSSALAAKAVVGTCAVIATAAIFVVATGAQTVRECGAASILTELVLITIMSFGLAPLVVALLGVGAGNLFPQLRAPWIWIASAMLLSAAAWGVVAAAAVHGYPTSPAPYCTL